MPEKINDILENLDSDIDIKDSYKEYQPTADKLEKETTNDILKQLDDLNVWWRRYSLIKKIKTKNFDSVVNKKRLKKLDLSEKPNHFQIVLTSIKNKIKNLKPQKKKKKIKKKTFTKGINLKNKKIFTKKFFLKTTITLLVLSALLVVDKIVIEKQIKSWYSKILSIKDNITNIENSRKTINNAKLDFIISDILFKPFLLIDNENIDNWYYIIEWWKKLTKFLDEWIQAYIALKQFIDDKKDIENIKLTNLLQNMRPDFEKLYSMLNDTISIYNKVTDLWSQELNSQFEKAKAKLTEAQRVLNIVNNNYDTFLSIMWHRKEKNYLILFQNNDEIRPTWWFMWSLATVSIKSWKITNFVRDDIYAYEWDINKVYTDKESAPEWLHEITWTFWLRDANYFIEHNRSSRKIKFFLDKINKDIDAIIYINQNTILDFLEYTWEIHFSKLWTSITKDNFSLVISTLVEAKVFKVWTLWTPKQILFDFANDFLSILKAKKDYSKYMEIIDKNIKSRDLVIYSFDPKENKLLEDLWLTWKIDYSKTLDFAYPVYTSIWWNKSDRYIETKYKKSIKTNNDCSVDTNLNIYRAHHFSKLEEEKVVELLNKYWVEDQTDIINIQWRWTNKSYTRVVLPKQAVVTPKEWLTVYKEQDYTVAEFYITTRRLESTNYDIEYKIPNINCQKYDFKLYKQPGIKIYDVDIIKWWDKIKKRWITWDFKY